MLFCYASPGAAHAGGLDPSIGPIICHGAAQALKQVYRESGVALPATVMVSDVTDKAALKNGDGDRAAVGRRLAMDESFGDYSDAFASGWMLLRGARRRRGVDRGFVLSDHADWPGLMRAITATQAERIIVTHGSIPVMVRWLQQNGWQAGGFETEYGDDEADDGVPGVSTAAEDVTHA